MANFLLLREIVERKGVPGVLYSDRHGIFQRSPKEAETMEEQLEGRRHRTQFGRALEELGIQAIFALSPQAKGRVERLFGTLQHRLVSELRLAGASSIEEANRVLEGFLPRYNAGFGLPAAEPGCAYRQLPQGLALEEVLCFKYRRTVASDNSVRFNGHSIQLLPGPDRLSYARAGVEVQERLDGSLKLWYQGRMLASREAPAPPAVLRARKGGRCESTPPDRGLSLELLQPQPSPLPEAGRVGPQSGAPPCHSNKRPGGKLGPEHPWRKYPAVTKSVNH